jgi:hypothetical protein
MKYLIIILLFLLPYSNIYGQKKSILLSVFNEYSISVNNTLLFDDNTKNRVGFGAGVYHTFMAEKHFNVTTGLEYNLTSQFKYIMYEGHFSNSTDITYYFNNLSVPALIRFNIGKKTKLFFDTGGFMDLNIGARQKGTRQIYSPNQTNQLEYQEYEINEKCSISPLNYGFSGGIGVKIPVASHELIIKIDYKHGLHKLQEYHDEINNRYARLMVGISL